MIGEEGDRAFDAAPANHFTKPDRYDGSTPWRTYLRHFELVAVLNRWDDRTKALKLATSLKGKVMNTLTAIPNKTVYDYRSLVAALRRRFDPIERTELLRVQLRNRRQRSDESLVELSDDILSLVDRAYADLHEDARETLALSHFIDALEDSELRCRILESRMARLEEAVTYGMEFEVIQRAEQERLDQRNLNRVKSTGATYGEETVISGVPESLRTEMREIIKVVVSRGHQGVRSSRIISCYECGGDHMKRHCPVRRNRRCYECGSTDHLAARYPKIGYMKSREEVEEVEVERQRPSVNVRRISIARRSSVIESNGKQNAKNHEKRVVGADQSKTEEQEAVQSDSRVEADQFDGAGVSERSDEADRWGAGATREQKKQKTGEDTFRSVRVRVHRCNPDVEKTKAVVVTDSLEPNANVVGPAPEFGFGDSR